MKAANIRLYSTAQTPTIPTCSNAAAAYTDLLFWEAKDVYVSKRFSVAGLRILDFDLFGIYYNRLYVLYISTQK